MTGRGYQHLLTYLLTCLLACLFACLLTYSVSRPRQHLITVNVLWLNRFNAELSPKKYQRGPRSQCWGRGRLYLKPLLNWANVCSPNILRTLQRTMIRFLIELLIRRIWFGQSKLYFILNWLVMRCKLRPELAEDAQQTA